MKIMILGSDGYIGYPLTLHLLKKGHEVFGVDNYSRRQRVEEVGSNSLTPITTHIGRKGYLKHSYSQSFVDQVDISLGKDSPGYIRHFLKEFKPEAIVHLAEQPSAPWSMISVNEARATQIENIIGTLDLLWAIRQECPTTHLVKLGTMGEYGTPNCDIPEGKIPEVCLGNKPESLATPVPCPMSGLLFPRTPGSFYHLTKVHDTFNIEFCCRIWGLRSTDIMQGVLYGVKVTGEEGLEQITRFDYDQYFGTAINRFCAQALINHPLTIYGKGEQTRGYLPLKDSIQCLTIAIENPPEQGTYRTLNQFEDTYSINELAHLVQNAAYDLGMTSERGPIPNPRIEAEEHYYNPHHQTLFDLGYKPTVNTAKEIKNLLLDLEPFSNRINEKVIMPTTKWR